MSSGSGEYSVREAYLMSSEDDRYSVLPSAEEAKKRFLAQAMHCPLCKTPPERLSWVYLVIPEWACRDAVQRKGWVTICDHCKLQIDFFAEEG
jgi:hypothetical protein